MRKATVLIVLMCIGVVLMGVYTVASLVQNDTSFVVNTTSGVSNDVRYNLNEMDNGLTRENITFGEGDTHWRYLNIPNQSTSVTATLNIANVTPIEYNSLSSITNCQELQDMNNNLSNNYILTNSVDCMGFDCGDGKGFKPIGNLSSPYDGIFNGNGKTISNLMINRPNEDCVGLFGRFKGGSALVDTPIFNLVLDKVNITGKDYVGALVGNWDDYHGKDLRNIIISGDITGVNKVGGLIGWMLNVDTRNLYVNVTVNGNTDVGGIYGEISSANANAMYVYAIGSVNGSTNVGGIVGTLTSGYLRYSFSDINVTGLTNVGSVVGENIHCVDCQGGSPNIYWNNHSGNSDSAVGFESGAIGREDMETVVIQDNKSYFYNISAPPISNWDFVSVWSSSNDLISFPSLKFSNIDIFAHDISIDVGNDGDNEFNHIGNLTTTNTTVDFSSEVNDYLANCSFIDGICSVPIKIIASNGMISLDTINVTYDYNLNNLFERIDIYTWNATKDLVANLNYKRRYKILPISDYFIKFNISNTLPVGKWKLNGSAVDSSNNGNDGTWNGTETYVQGIVGQAADFDGINNRISIINDTSIKDIFSGGGTISVWAYPKSYGGTGDYYNGGTIVNKGGYSLSFKPGIGKVEFRKGFTSYTGIWNFNLSLNSWTHITVSYDSDSTINEPLIYLNGSLTTVVETFNPLGASISDTPYNLTIGSQLSIAQYAWDGYISDVRLYNGTSNNNRVRLIFGESEGTLNESDVTITNYTIKIHHSPLNNIYTSGYYLRNNTATQCEINNIPQTVTDNYCTYDFSVSKYGNWPIHYIWDNNISLVPAINKSSIAYNIDGKLYINDTITYFNPDLTAATAGLFTNTTIEYYYNTSITNNEKLEILISETWYDITPSITSDCIASPSYTRTEHEGRVFYSCLSTIQKYISYKIESSN